jgi:hypothetical protein
MKWLLLLTILSGYSGSSTATASFDSKEACESAGKSHDEAIRQLHWHSFAVVHSDCKLMTGIAGVSRRRTWVLGINLQTEILYG